MTKTTKQTCVVVTGPSGVGKDTVVTLVLEKIPNLKKFITTTTRPKRDYEVHGQHYYFVTEEEFLNGIKNGEFIEWDHHYKGYYGCHRARLEEFLTQNPQTLVLIDPNGAKTIKNLMPSAVVIFLMPSSVEELRERLKHRGEIDDVIETRMREAPREIEEARLANYHQVINLHGAAEDAANQVVSILASHLE